MDVSKPYLVDLCQHDKFIFRHLTLQVSVRSERETSSHRDGFEQPISCFRIYHDIVNVVLEQQADEFVFLNGNGRLQQKQSTSDLALAVRYLSIRC
eukprot:187272-Hanusia_phi.AAC.1